MQQRRKLGCRELAALGAANAVNRRWLEAVVDGSPRKEPTKSKTATLIVHGPGGIRLEITDPQQVTFRGATLVGVGRKGPMLSFTGSLKISVAVEPCNMRKGTRGWRAA